MSDPPEPKHTSLTAEQWIAGRAVEGLPPLSDDETRLAEEILAQARAVQPEPGFVQSLQRELSVQAARRQSPAAAAWQRLRSLSASLGWVPGLAGIAVLLLVLVLAVSLIPRGSPSPAAGIPESATVTPSFAAGSQEPTAAVPSAIATPVLLTNTVEYVVQQGDTLAYIAQLSGLSQKDLLALNGLNDSSELRVGQMLVIGFSSQPTKSPPAAAADQVSIDQAGQLIRAWYTHLYPDLNPAVTIPLKELTTAEIWDRLGVQVFQVTGDIYQYETFLIRRGGVTPLGTGFGGVGVTSLVVADLDGDGQPELLYTYSFGSGLHRSRLALYSPALPGDGLLESSTYLLNKDMLLIKVDDRRVYLKAALASSVELLLGQASLGLQDGQPRLDLLVYKGIPPAVLDNIQTGPIPTLYPPVSPTSPLATPLAYAGLPGREEGLLAMVAPVGGTSQVFVLPADASDWSMVSDGVHASIWPSLSPDGQKVAYAVDFEGKGYNFDIVVADLATHQVTTVASDPTVDMHPVWSPDGSRIAFESARNPQNETTSQVRIYVMDADGSNVKPVDVPEGTASLSGWSPDGKEILYTIDERQAKGDPDLPAVFSAIDLASGKMRTIASFQTHLKVVNPSLSPDGKRIAYEGASGDLPVVFVMDPDGSNVRQVGATGSEELNPLWSPDGRWLVFSQFVGETLVPFFAPADGSAPARPAGFSGQVTSWSSDTAFIPFSPTKFQLPTVPGP